MEINYSDILAAHEAIKQLVARYKAEMSMDLALACARIRRQLEAEIGVYQEIRNDLILEFGDEIQHEGRAIKVGVTTGGSWAGSGWLYVFDSATPPFAWA